jgi:DNA repair photolyase
MQWGGLADAFDENERKYGITLELLEFFHKIKYPISFSTKATWFLNDDRYLKYLKNSDFFHFKITIVTDDDEIAKRIEVLVPSPQERLLAIEKLKKLNIGGITLRFRPFIIGISENSINDLFATAKSVGADSVSTEFLCIEERSKNKSEIRYRNMSVLTGYDILDFYKKNSHNPGYLRLNRATKKPFIEKMASICDNLGLRFYVSDAHFKEYCHNGSCCGLSELYNYSREQFTEALLFAKRNGRVKFSDIYKENNFDFPFNSVSGFNTNSAENRSKFSSSTMFDYIRYNWNNVKSSKSPYKYFGYVFIPVGVDEEKNVIYEYRE